MGDSCSSEVEDRDSIATLARLERLLRALSQADRSSFKPLSEYALDRYFADRAARQRDTEPRPSLIGPQYEYAAQDFVASIQGALERFARGREESWTPMIQGQNGEAVWSLGTLIYRLEQRPILRGDIELRRAESIAAGIPDGLLRYLVTVPGTTDQLTRETHGHWGYHYHYLDSQARRSDTLLTFDRNSTSLTTPRLCWERHAEGDKFKAKPNKWGAGKRQSVYSVCYPDSQRFDLMDFKQPKAEAETVWPLPDPSSANPVAG